MGTSNSSITSRYWLCPLYSFNCDSGSVDLIEGIQIKHVTIELKNYFREHPPFEGLGYGTGGFDWVLSILCTEPILDSKMVNIASDKEDTRALFIFRCFIEACRVYKRGNIRPGPLTLFHIRDSDLSPGKTFELSYLSRFEWFYRQEYKFLKSDIPLLNRLIMDIVMCRRLDMSGTLNRVLSRFCSAYGGELDDRLIDQMIAFESLYIADDKELGYKLALRTAFFLGTQRAKIFNDMKKAYNTRGKIVHGNKAVKRSELESTIPKTEEYLRQSIKKFLSLLSKGMSIKEIRDKLDENILKNGKPLALKE